MGEPQQKEFVQPVTLRCSGWAKELLMNNQFLLVGLVVLIAVGSLAYGSVTSEAVPDRATETTQLLVLDQLVVMNANLDSLESDIEVLNNRVIVSNTLAEANLQTFAIDEVSDRFFVKNVNVTGTGCLVFDKVFQTDESITCLEPFLSLTTQQKLDYNANYTLP